MLFPHDKTNNNNNFSVEYLENLKICNKKFTNIEEATQFSNRIESIYNKDIIEIEVKNLLKLKKNIRSKLRHYRIPVDFPEKEIPNNPYNESKTIMENNKNKSCREWKK